MGQVHRWELDWEAEERHYRRAIELNLGYATAHQWYGGLLQILGRLEEARQHYEWALELEPNFTTALANLAGIYATLGRTDDAYGMLERMDALDSDREFRAELQAWVYASMGRVEEARKLISEIEEISDPGILGGFYAIIGEHDRAFEFMSRAVDEGSLMMPLWLKSNPDFDSHRNDPRYLRLLERLNFPLDSAATSFSE